MKTATDYFDQALILLKMGKLDKAAKLYLHALSLDPNFTKAYNNLGMIFKLQGDLQKAEDYYQKALKLNPNLVPVYSNLANIYRIKGNLNKAEQFCNKAIKLEPGFADAYNILGAVLQIQGKNKEAVKQYKRAIKLAPGFVDAYSNLGTALQAVGQIDEAIENYRKAIELDLDDPNPFYNLGNILKNKGDLLKAMEVYEMVIKLQPDFSDAYNQLIDVSRQLCNWGKLKKYSKKLDNLTASSLPQNMIYGETPFNAIVSHDLPQRSLKIAKLWAVNIAAAEKNPPFKFDFGRIDPKKSPLRIGYLSGNFTDHPVGHLIKSMFAAHNRKRFKIYGYCFGRGDKMGFRSQIKKGCDKFYDIDKLSFEETARRIYNDKIDILVDLMGYTDGSRFEVFAKHPSPIQISYLGFPGSTGADFIDYAIVDKTLVPPDQEKNYSEKLIFMHDCYQVNDSWQKISTKEYRRVEFGLPKDAFVFCSFNKVSKITPEMFRTWMNILKAVPGSVLWLPQSLPQAEDNLRQFRGSTPNRIIFGRVLPLEEHLKRLVLADLMLDTYPYSGGATTSHALRMELPVITLAGKSYLSRMSASLLTAVGLPELITHSFREYEKLAIDLAENPEKLNALHLTLNANKKSSSLFNTAKFVKDLERAFQKIWELYTRGEPPQNIEVGLL